MLNQVKLLQAAIQFRQQVDKLALQAPTLEEVKVATSAEVVDRVLQEDRDQEELLQHPLKSHKCHLHLHSHLLV